MQNLSSAVIGSIIAFRYWGGSNPGSTRTVEVTSVRDYGITGIDLDIPEGQNNIRNFSDVDAEDIRVLSTPEVKAVPFYEAMNIVKRGLSSEQLAELYGQMMGAVKAQYDVIAGQVVITMPAVRPAKTTSFKVVNAKGEEISVVVRGDVYEFNGQSVAREQFSEILAQHVLTK